MNPEHYTLVFSVADSCYKAWWFPAAGLVLMLLFSIFVPLIVSIKRPDAPLGDRLILTAFFVGFAMLWTIISFVTTIGNYLANRSALKNGSALYVEGVVENFIPMTPHKHGEETFDVGGVPFGYSDNIVIAGFNHTAYYGGPIHEGLPVHIWYRNTARGNDNEILKLEIAEK